MTRRILNRIAVDKIACVDIPCQQLATVRILKAYDETRHPRGERGRWAAAAESSKRAFYHARAAHAALRRAGAASDAHEAIKHVADAAHSTHEMLQHARYVRALGHRTARELGQMIFALAHVRGRFGKRDTKEQITMSKLDELTGQVDQLISKITSALNDHGSDGEPEDMYDSLPSGDEEDPEDEEEQDGYSMSVGKRSVNEHLRVNDSSDRPGSLKSSTHGNGRHKFEALRDAIVNEEGVPKTQAMHLARQRHPDLYDDYVNGNGMGKRASSFEEMVRNEALLKGCTPTVAAQRLLYQHGGQVLDRSSSIAKAVDAEGDFIAKAQAIYEQSGGAISKCESLRAARRAAPSAFKRLQRS
jgi:hypothetical protein